MESNGQSRAWRFDPGHFLFQPCSERMLDFCWHVMVWNNHSRSIIVKSLRCHSCDYTSSMARSTPQSRFKEPNVGHGYLAERSLLPPTREFDNSHRNTDYKCLHLSSWMFSRPGRHQQSQNRDNVPSWISLRVQSSCKSTDCGS